MATHHKGVFENQTMNDKVDSENPENPVRISEEDKAEDLQKNNDVEGKLLPPGQPGLGTSLWGSWDPSILASPTHSDTGGGTGGATDGVTGDRPEPEPEKEKEPLVKRLVRKVLHSIHNKPFKHCQFLLMNDVRLFLGENLCQELKEELGSSYYEDRNEYYNNVCTVLEQIPSTEYEKESFKTIYDESGMEVRLDSLADLYPSGSLEESVKMVVKDWGVITQHLSAKYMEIVAIAMKMKDIWKHFSVYKNKKIDTTNFNPDSVRNNIVSQLKLLEDMETKFLETNVNVSLMITANVTAMEDLQIPEIMQKFNLYYENLKSYKEVRCLYDIVGKEIELLHAVVSYDNTKVGVRKLFEEDFQDLVVHLNKELEMKKKKASRVEDWPDDGFQIRVRNVHQVQNEEEVEDADESVTDVTKESILGDLRETERVPARDDRRSVSVVVPDPLQKLFDRKNNEKNQQTKTNTLNETVNLSPVSRLSQSQGGARDAGTPANGPTRTGPAQTSTVNKVLFGPVTRLSYRDRDSANSTWRASGRNDRGGGGGPPGGGGRPPGGGGGGGAPGGHDHPGRGGGDGGDRDGTLEVLKSNRLKKLINDVVEMSVTVLEAEVGQSEADISYAINNLAHVQKQISKVTDSYDNFVAYDPANEINEMEIAGQMTPVCRVLQECGVRVASRKALLEDREKRSQQFQAENRKIFLSGKDLKFPVMLDKYNALQWICKINRIFMSNNIPENMYSVLIEIKKCLPLEDQIRHSETNSLQSLLGDIRTRYASIHVAHRYVFKHVLECFIKPQSVTMMLNTIKIIHQKLVDLCDWGSEENNYFRQIPLEYIKKIEQICFIDSVYQEYLKELHKKYPVAQLGKLYNPVTEGLRKLESFTPNIHDVSRIETRTGDAENAAERAVFLLDKVCFYYDLYSSRLGEEEILGEDVEKAKAHLTDESYNKTFAVQIKCQEQQVLKEDFIARFQIELKGKIPYQPRNNYSYGGAGRGKAQYPTQSSGGAGGGSAVFTTTVTPAPVTTGGGRQQLEKKPCTCEDDQCVGLVTMGNVLFCPKFRKLDVNERRQYLFDNRRCYECGERMTFDHKSKNCKQKERNNCKANHPPGESRKHNWLLCQLRAQELAKSTNVKVMELSPGEGETVLKMISEEDDGGGIIFDLADYDDEGETTNLSVMMANIEEEETEKEKGKEAEKEEQKHPFEGVIEVEGGYSKSKYNVKEALNRLLEAAKKARESPDVKEIESAVELVQEVEDQCSKVVMMTAAEAGDLAEIKKVLSDTLRELSKEDAQEIRHMISNKRRVEVNREHWNQPLFREMVKNAIEIFQEENSILGIGQIRIKKKKNEDKHGLVSKKHLIEERVDGEDYVKVYCLIDSGSHITAFDSDLEEYIEFQHIKYKEEIINGAGGPQKQMIRKANVQLVSNESESYTVSGRFLPKLQCRQHMSSLSKALIIAQCGMPREIQKKFIWPDSVVGTTVHAIIGQDSLQLHCGSVDPAVLGLLRFPLSPGLQINRMPFSADKERQYVVTGQQGVDPSRIGEKLEDVYIKERYPTFLLSPDVAKLPTMPEDMKISVKEIKDVVLAADQCGAEFEDYKQCMAIFKEDVSPGKVNDYVMTQISKKMDAEDTEQLAEEMLVRELSDVSFEQPSEVSVMMCNSEVRVVDRFQAAEAGYRYRVGLCEEHQHVISKCPQCAAADSQEVLDSNTLNDKLYKSLYTVQDEKDPDRFYIKSDLDVYEDHPEIGELRHSMIEQAVNSSRKMVEKAIRTNNVEEMDRQFIKQEKNGFIELVSSDVVEAMAKGEHKCNFVRSNYVQKFSSLRTKLRIIRDPSGRLPNSNKTLCMVQECPRKQLNSLVTAALTFMAYAATIQLDVSSAYNCIGASPSIESLSHFIYFYQAQLHGTSQPLVCKSGVFNFGIPFSGAFLFNAIRRFPGGDLHGLAKLLVIGKSFVDNFLSTTVHNCLIAINCVATLMQQAFLKYHIYLLERVQAGEENAEAQTLFGLDWSVSSDMISSHWDLNLHKTSRGVKTGPNIAELTIDWRKFTRRHVSRLVSQGWCVTGRLKQPVLHSMRIMLSKVCAVTDAQQLDRPIAEYSEEVAKMAADFFNSLKGFGECLPLERAVIPMGYELSHFVCSHDASASGYGATIHAVSKKLSRNKVDKDEYRSMIVYSQSRVQDSTVFKNEMKSFGMAAEIMEAVIRAWKGIITERPVTIYCIGDNRPACSVLSNAEYTDVMPIGIRAFVTDTAARVVRWCPNMDIVFSWMDTHSHPSDLVSKFHEHTLTHVNGTFWRNGPTSFLSQKLLDMFRFCRYSTEGKVYNKLPTLPGETLNEVVANYALVELKSLLGAENREKPLDLSSSRKRLEIHSVMIVTRAGTDLAEKAGMVQMHTPVRRYRKPGILFVNELRGITGMSGDLTSVQLWSPGQDSRVVTPTMRMSKEWYQSEADQFENLGRLVRKMAMVLLFLWKCSKKWRGRCQKYEKLSALSDGFVLLLKADQCLYKVAAAGLHVGKTDIGVVYIIRHLVAEQELYRSCTAPLVNSGGLMAAMVFEWAHKTAVHIPHQGSTAHHAAAITKNQILNCNMGVYFHDMPRYIRYKMLECGFCMRLAEKYFNVKQGDSYSRLAVNSILFSTVSMDPLARIKLSVYKGSRQKHYMYVLLWKCHYSSVVEATICDALTKESLAAAVRVFMAKCGVTPKEIHVDAAVQFTDRVLNGKCQDGEVVMPGCKIVRTVAKGQRQNLIESSVQSVKKVLNSLVKRNSQDNWEEAFSKLTLSEFVSIMELCIYFTNSLPISAVSHICGNHIKFGIRWSQLKMKLPDLPLDEETMTEYERIFLRCTEFCQEELLSCLQAKEAKYRLKYHKQNKGKLTDLEVALGDLVQVSENGNKTRLGVVEAILSDSTVRLRTMRGDIKRLKTSLQPVLCLRPRNRCVIDINNIFVPNDIAPILFMNMIFIFVSMQDSGGKLVMIDQHPNILCNHCYYYVSMNLCKEAMNDTCVIRHMTEESEADTAGVSYSENSRSPVISRPLFEPTRPILGVWTPKGTTSPTLILVLWTPAQHMKGEAVAMMLRTVLPVLIYVITMVVSGQAGDSFAGGATLNFWWRKPELRDGVTYESGGVKYVTTEFLTTMFDRAMLEFNNKLATEKQNTAFNSALVYALCIIVGVGIIGVSLSAFANHRQRQATANQKREQEEKFKSMYNFFTKQQVLAGEDFPMKQLGMGNLQRQRPSNLDLTGI